MSDKKEGVQIRVRPRVTSPEVQRYEQRKKAEAAAAIIPTESKFQAGYNRRYTHEELENLSDDMLIRILLNTPHQRIHVDALAVAKKRESLSKNPIVMRKLSESARATEDTRKKMSEHSLVTLIPGVPGGKRWYEVQIGANWHGRVFGTAEDFMGQAYRKYTQEVQTPETNPRVSFHALPTFTLPN